VRNVQRLELDTHNWCGVAQDQPSYLNPGKVPKGSLCGHWFFCL